MSDTLDQLDLLDLDAELPEEDRLLRDTMRKFADDRLRPHIREWFESGTLPAREVLRNAGLRPPDDLPLPVYSDGGWVTMYAFCNSGFNPLPVVGISPR